MLLCTLLPPTGGQVNKVKAAACLGGDAYSCGQIMRQWALEFTPPTKGQDPQTERGTKARGTKVVLKEKSLKLFCISAACCLLAATD